VKKKPKSMKKLGKVLVDLGGMKGHEAAVLSMFGRMLLGMTPKPAARKRRTKPHA